MRSKTRIVSAIVLALALALIASASSLAQSTTKQLSTNFTLVNLGSGTATGTISYIKQDGTPWGSETLNIPGNGGQAIFRQYDPSGSPGNPGLTSGAGSVMVMADQPLGAVVQILARNQNPTSSGAYAGLSTGAPSFYVPLVAKQLGTSSGIGNSQIVVQNTGGSSTTVQFQFVGGGSTYTYTSPSIANGASFTCDLTTTCGASAGVPNGWFGSAVVSAAPGGTIAVVSNFFTGDALQTFNAFSSTAPKTKWFVPLFTSRLPNSLSTPIAIQNLSGSTIPANGIQVVCTPDAGATGFSPITKTNPAPVNNNESFFVNPVTDGSIPTGFFGSCVITASANVVAFVQMRFVNTGEAAAYEAIPDGGTDQKVIIPLVAKRLPNGFSTAVTIQNLSSSAATVTLTYTPSSGSPITISGVTIPGNGSLIQNHRITAGIGAVPQLPDGWTGTLTVSSNTPVNAFVQLTFQKSINPNLANGDLFMAHNAFTQP
ncbi:MAG: hypothetical protein K6T87_11655 [Roseiflexus sp.]|uniref:hypothetical protein n=1 Tax=Roseiflexus sp. TaxID=2562120 RepID=UPI0025DF095D|nr:hypothetical protein [Roseiflexus sp.]MCL6541213.1 hypothetical protein [Roseiflexus sp.]